MGDGSPPPRPDPPPVRIDREQEAVLREYARLVGESPVNLVATGDRGHVWERHVVEAIAVCDQLPASHGEHWLDLGTGGGLPGIVLAVVGPGLEVTLLDAREKKARAVTGFADALGLRGVRAIAARAERLAWDASHRGRYDGVTCRAVGKLVPSAELARGFVRPGGTIAVVRGRDAADEMRALEAVATRLRVGRVRRERVASAPRETWLVTMRAEGPPPHGIPRRDGVPTSQPLDLPGHAGG